MVISQQSILFFIVMLLYIFFTSSSHVDESFLYKFITVSIITFCIQYLAMVNLPFISWLFVFIPIIYILSIIILQYLISV